MSARNGFIAHRRTVLYISKLLFLALGSLPVTWAAPLRTLISPSEEGRNGFGTFHKETADPSLWLDLTVSIFLVLLGGIFAGLTIALMGQDEINLQVIAKSGRGAEKRHATRVLRLLTRGKHWVLVTLLLSNVITNETLPIVLDRSLGGGWPAVLGSTVAIVIFGEIIPQSVCVRFGLAIGAWMSPFVLILMYIEAPVAWPTAKLLDRLIGEDHGTTYSKAGLKTLVTIHKTFGDAGERLNEDEVTIIGAVLELKNKSVGAIMTPMDDVFTMSLDTILDERMMETILSAGYSRIPIHRPDNPVDFVGMLLVKILITYDPEDCKPVSDFALATLPETAPETSCLDILNFFQEGKSHMVLVSEKPGENEGAVGVITLEDVIEELIGEEIVDESDVFIDVHKAIRRLQPAPAARLSKSLFTAREVRSRDGSVTEPRPDIEQSLDPISEYDADDDQDPSDPVARRPRVPSITLASPKHTTFTLRRRSSGVGNNEGLTVTTCSDSPDLREKLRHLGPSNLASRPRSTRFQSVKIKPGAPAAAAGSHTEPSSMSRVNSRTQPPNSTFQLSSPTTGGVGEGLVRDAGIDASDGVQALHTGYGTIDAGAGRPLSAVSNISSSKADANSVDAAAAASGAGGGVGGGVGGGGSGRRSPPQTTTTGTTQMKRSGSAESSSSDVVGSLPRRGFVVDSNESAPLLGSIGRQRTPRGTTRSGSITEQIVEYNGIRKVVLDISSSSDDQPSAVGVSGGGGAPPPPGSGSGSDRAGRTNSGGMQQPSRPEASSSSSQRQQHHRGPSASSSAAVHASQNNNNNNDDDDDEGQAVRKKKKKKPKKRGGSGGGGKGGGSAGGGDGDGGHDREGESLI